MKTWLIQRGIFRDNVGKKGIESILSFDYMGSSEFEWGALPKSVGRIRDKINTYTYLDIPIKDKVISVFCKETQKYEAKMYLEELAENKMRLQEFSAFNNYINDDGYFKDKFDFWWDIENDLMFWKKNVEFEMKFKSLIK
jgi:hypothetical protein